MHEEASFAEIAHSLAPSEDLFDALSDALADDVARWASGAPVDGRAAVALEVLGGVTPSFLQASTKPRTS